MDRLKISEIQRQFWLIQKVYRNNLAYNIPVIVKFDGVPDIKALEYAYESVVKRHEALRSYFRESNDEVFLENVSIGQVHLSIPVIEITGELHENELPEEIVNEVHAAFDLGNWPLHRAKLFLFPGGTSVLMFVFNHIITDLESKKIFSEELSEFYNSYKDRNNPSLRDMTGNYSDYTREAEEWLKTKEADEMKSEWKKFIPEVPENPEFPSDFPKPKVNSQEGKRKHFTLGGELYREAASFAAKNNVTTFTVFLAIWASLLHRLTGQNKLIIGVPFTNRKKDEFKNTFGCFVNIIPLPVTFDEDISCIDLLKQIRYSLLKMHRIQEMPFMILNDLLKKSGSNQIFYAGFTFEPPVNLALGDMLSAPLKIEKNGAQLDLFLTLWEEDDDLNGYLEFSTLLFMGRTASHFIDIFRQLAASFLRGSAQKISQLDILSDEEKRTIMSWNDTDHEYSRNMCLSHKLEEQVRKTPDSTAVLFGRRSLTYSEFDRHVNRLANYLVKQGVKTEDVVCVCMERSPELLIALYAIHKAGAAYMPVDPSYPAARLAMMLDDALPVLVLTKKHSEANLPSGFRKIPLDDILEKPLSSNDTAPRSGCGPGNLAYLIYTSGSTGKPKGVMIEHHSVINKLEWMQFRHPLGSSDTILLKTPVTFDVSVWELFWWMFNGARVAILPAGGEKEPRMIIDEIFSKQVTTTVFVPSMFSHFVEYVKTKNETAKLHSLKWIIQIGEALTPQLVNSFNELLTPEFDPLMVNTYGPTETTVAVSWYDCPKEKNIEKIYIGKPIYNTRMLVVNSRNMIQPAGVPGELVITGENLSRGYLNRPELTDDKFIYLRYPDGQCIRGYRTGDLVKWSYDGNIEFIGRTDFQVKLRGYRIELGEIESKILDMGYTKAAVVAVKELRPGNMMIAAYVVLKEHSVLSAEAIKKYLAGKLPDYMVPSYITIMDELPLNTSGKIDRKALPLPEFGTQEKLVDPHTSYEKRLLEIWKETLGVAELGITQNFFDVGGNSLLAVHMVSQIRKKFNLDIEPVHMMEHPNIRSLAAFLSEGGDGGMVEDTVIDRSVEMRKQAFSVLRQKRTGSPN